MKNLNVEISKENCSPPLLISPPPYRAPGRENAVPNYERAPPPKQGKSPAVGCKSIVGKSSKTQSSINQQQNGTHLYAHTVAGWHGTKPENATISGDKENFYNTIAQALTADNKPDPNGCGRVKLLDWIRKRRPDLLPVARLIMGTPSFIRLVKAEGALRLPSADGDDLDLSAADWDPLSLECPDYNDPNYAKSACGVIQGRALSTILSVCFLHEICHAEGHLVSDSLYAKTRPCASSALRTTSARTTSPRTPSPPTPDQRASSRRRRRERASSTASASRSSTRPRATSRARRAGSGARRAAAAGREARMAADQLIRIFFR